MEGVGLSDPDCRFKNKMLPLVKIYSKKDCHLCDEAKAVLFKVQKKVPFKLIEIDIDEHADLFEKYREKIPVVFIDERIAFKYRIDERKLIKKIQDASSS